MKEFLNQYIEKTAPEMEEMADFIFDHPEVGLEEFKALEKLTDWLKREGFHVEIGVGKVPTAFRAVYHHGQGGPNIGFLCEYDALPGMGHGCGHHLQGPAVLAAAAALRHADSEENYTVTVYGTPAEESVSGKIMMIRNGCDFTELDAALMMHGGPMTQVDVKSLAMDKFTVTYRGISAHAAVKPYAGRSALDGLILAFQGLEFLREHVQSDVKIHYTVLNCGGTPANIVPASAAASLAVRSYNRTYLDSVVERVRKVLEGAAMMTETEVEIRRDKSVDNKVPVIFLNDLIMKNAEAVNAPRIAPPRQETGSTDFGNVLHRVPGSCIRIAFAPEGSAAHSEAYIRAGKTEEAHAAVGYAAKILAGTAWDLISCPENLQRIREEFQQALEKENIV